MHPRQEKDLLVELGPEKLSSGAQTRLAATYGEAADAACLDSAHGAAAGKA